MTIYMYGRRVTEQERNFLTNVITGSTRLERGKQFKAICLTAKRNNTSLQNAVNLYNNNKDFITQLNEGMDSFDTYCFNKAGEICKKIGKHLEKYNPQNICKNSTDKPSKTLSFVQKYVKPAFLYIKEMFKVY